jgi:hypothetical protein
LILALASAACGGGDKKPSATVAAPKDQPAAAATPGVAARSPTVSKASARASSTASASKDEEAVGGLFNLLFNKALNGGEGGDTSGLGEGDPNLTKYLPSNADLPPGYTSRGQQTYRAPDGISETGGMDIAVEVATTGDVSTDQPDFSNAGVLMALVIKPDDLQSLGDAFDAIKGLDEQDLEDALLQGTGTDGLFTLKDVRVFDTDGLGDGNVGFQMTIDLGAFGAIFSGLAGDATPEPGAPDLSNLQMTMRIYLFARGDYAGGIVRMAFTDKLSDDVDEVELAKIIDGKLKGAP